MVTQSERATNSSVPIMASISSSCLDLDAVGLEIGLEIAPADIVRTRHHELERLRNPAAASAPAARGRAAARRSAFRGRAPAGAISARCVPSKAGTTAKSSSSVEHHLGEQAAIALDDMQAHVRDSAARNRSSIGASTARVKVGISPMRSSPVTKPASARASSPAVSSSADRLNAAPVIAQARRRRRDRPAVERSNSLTPSVRSTVATCWEMPDCVAFSRAAARVNEPFLAYRDDGSDLPQSDLHAIHYKS